MTDPMTDTDKADFSTQILDTLRTELTEAGLESDHFNAILKNIGEKVQTIITDAKREQDVPFEIRKLLLDIDYENLKRRACVNALEKIVGAIRDLEKEKAERASNYEWKLDGLKERYGIE